MIGLRGMPLEADFQWAKYRKTRRELIELGATIVLTDDEAERIGIMVKLAKRYRDHEQERVKK